METKEIKEYHDNGQLAYEETIVLLPKNKEHLYPQRTQHSDGYCWIRTGIQAKYHDNGILAWELERNNKGEVISSKKGYRKDGTAIQY